MLNLIAIYENRLSVLIFVFGYEHVLLSTDKGNSKKDAIEQKK